MPWQPHATTAHKPAALAAANLTDNSVDSLNLSVFPEQLSLEAGSFVQIALCMAFDDVHLVDCQVGCLQLR